MTLVQQYDLEVQLEPGWHGDVLEDLGQRLIQPSDFPCFFSQNAFRRKLLKFIFIESLSLSALDHAAADLEAYIDRAKGWNGSLATAEPLIVAFSLAAARFSTVEAYHDLGWQVLQRWHDNDKKPWPTDVSGDPHSPFWSMCYAGTQLFVNMSCPAHKKRKSRHLGRHFLFIVNPRERFDVVAGDNPEGDRVRERIRSRINAYDEISHCPQLGSYQAGELEWWQYGIPDENRTRKDKCPFHQAPT